MNSYSRMTTFGNKYGNKFIFMFWSVWVLRTDSYVKNAADCHNTVEFLQSAFQVFLFSFGCHEAYAELDIKPDQKLIKLDIKSPW